MKLNEINSKKDFDYSCIYLWTNLANGKKYVGQAHSFYNRMKQYQMGFFNKYMKKAINKYGVDNFDITILEKDVPFDNLDDREQYWLDFYESYKSKNGYNICQFAGTTFGFRHSEESKKKMSEKLKERYNNPENREKLMGENNGMYGKHHTKESLKRISESSKKNWENPEYREKQPSMKGKNNHMYDVHLCGELNGMYGKKHSDETKKKISKANSGNKWSDEQRYDVSNSIICIELDKIYLSMLDAAQDMGVSRTAIYWAVTGKNKTCKGYHWKYKN